MWPVITLTFLLQLTEEEQLYAQLTPEPEAVRVELILAGEEELVGRLPEEDNEA